MDTFTIIPIEELERGEDGYCIPPEGVTVSANGAGYAKGHRGQVYPPGTFGENTTAFTSETSLQAIEKGVERKRKAIVDAIEGHYGVPLEMVVGDTVVTFMEQIVENELASPRSRLDTLDFIIEQTGLGESKTGQAQGGSIKIEGITPELAGQIKELVLLLQSSDRLELPHSQEARP